MVFAQLGGIATCSFADSAARIRGSFAGLHRWACLALGFHSIDACTLETHVELMSWPLILSFSRHPVGRRIWSPLLAKQ